MFNNGDIYIGKDPTHAGAEMLFDDLRIYNNLMKIRDIRSLASQSMTLLGEKTALLGCDSCNYNQALSSCTDFYHLCSLKELYAGAYHIARIMGWFRLNTEIWTRQIDLNDPNCNKD